MQVKKVQTYFHIRDLKPYEINIYERDKDIKATADWTDEFIDYHHLKEDIRIRGIQSQLFVTEQGFIIFGNTRYYAARELFLEGHSKFEYLPVLIEKDIYRFDFDHIPAIEEVRKKLVDCLKKTEPVIPTPISFKEYFPEEKDPYRIANLDGQPLIQNIAYYTLKAKKGYAVIVLEKLT